jgi:hypothetical protein
LQAHDEIIKEIQKVVGAQVYFFKSKIVLDIAKGVEDEDKAEKKEDDIDLEEEVEATSIGQPVNHLKQIG